MFSSEGRNVGVEECVLLVARQRRAGEAGVSLELGERTVPRSLSIATRRRV